ncbi:MAG: hypothetical protein FVQ85_18570 [Planctomycetes bacterium]|nr:hypothetical protein [Planctomycetota bacterium]
MSPVETIESETILHAEPELLVPISEYASREGLSRRTVDRYAQTGRLEKVRQHGQTYILDKPLKPQVQQTGQVRNVPDSQIVPLAQTDWMRLGYLQARSKSKAIWQTYAIALTVLFVALLLASLWLFTQWRFLIAP